MIGVLGTIFKGLSQFLEILNLSDLNTLILLKHPSPPLLGAAYIFRGYFDIS